MKYEEALEYIHSLEKFGIKPGMERITSLCRVFGDVHNSLRFIHIAGTNGKGSTSTMISECCRESGYKTGLFISPYVLDFRERIQINGEMIPKDKLTRIVEKMIPVAEEMDESPTEFEFITAAALLYFYEEKCDVVVLETGLGGRLDSTNIIKAPLASVITSVSFDHMGVLGNTLSEISGEKCGIIKENSVTVSYPIQHREAFEVIRKTAKEKNNLLLVPDVSKLSVEYMDITGTVAVYDGLRFRLKLVGEHMVYNAITAVTTLKAVRERGLPNITDKAIVDGIARTVMPARMQLVCDSPMIIIDGGHNVGCAEALFGLTDKFLKGKRIIGICGLMADKEYENYVSKIAPCFEKIITVTVNNPRSLSAAQLSECAGKYCDSEPAVSIKDAVKRAVSLAGDDGVVVVCGSFYMVSDVCEALKNII